MTIITKKQSSISVLVIAFATIMIAGTIASNSADDSAFASRNHHHSGHHQHHHSGHHQHHHSGHHNNKSFNINQQIDQSSSQHQNSFCLSAGAFSPVSASCNNTAASTNVNTGGNGAASDNSDNSGTNQQIYQLAYISELPLTDSFSY